MDIAFSTPELMYTHTCIYVCKHMYMLTPRSYHGACHGATNVRRGAEQTGGARVADARVPSAPAGKQCLCTFLASCSL